MVLGIAATGWSQDWRSTLYPADWTPAQSDAEGRFLHDFSWAGYRHGETPPVRNKKIVRALLKGAGDQTAAIQKAIDGAAGGVVLVPAGQWRVDGTLRITTSHTVLRGEGPDRTRLRFTKDAGLNGAAHLTVTGKLVRSGNWPLSEDAAVRGTSVRLESVDGIASGDQVVIGLTISDRFRADHGMGAYWKFASGKWRGLFRRVVTHVDKARKLVSFRVPLRYPLLLRYGASLRKESGYITECGIENLAVCNAVDADAAWKQTRTHAIDVRDAQHCWVRNVASYAEQVDHLTSGGIRVHNSRCVTVTGCSMAMAQHRGGGGNGYLFEIRQSNEVLTVNCRARRGRHNFIQNWDFGTSGCVWLRCVSRDGRALFRRSPPMGIVGTSEYHHSLSMACLVDGCTIDDGWQAVNRQAWSSGAGHTATQCVFWNCRGKGFIRSAQYGDGYVIGTAPSLQVFTQIQARGGAGTAPADFTEGIGHGATLTPHSLYEDQRRRRTASD